MKVYIKSLILMFVMIFVTISICSAATLVWDASTGTVEGYTMHYGTTLGNPTATLNVGNTTQYNIDSLPLSENTQYYFCISAYNSAGESDPCAPVAYTPADTTPPQPPVGLIAE
jgi:Fibronectin type III domain